MLYMNSSNATLGCGMFFVIIMLLISLVLNAYFFFSVKTSVNPCLSNDLSSSTLQNRYLVELAQRFGLPVETDEEDCDIAAALMNLANRVERVPMFGLSKSLEADIAAMLLPKEASLFSEMNRWALNVSNKRILIIGE